MKNLPGPLCSRYCEPEMDAWAEFAGAGYDDGSEEHYWWDVFEGLLDLMCPHGKK